jgi:hypothetical protein
MICLMIFSFDSPFFEKNRIKATICRPYSSVVLLPVLSLAVPVQPLEYAAIEQVENYPPTPQELNSLLAQQMQMQFQEEA